MIATPSLLAAAPLDAIAYRRAHTGKLMLISREEGIAPAPGDFFQFDAVGTHPTGLYVTGLFAAGDRRHMQASLVRDATPDEITLHRNSAP